MKYLRPAVAAALSALVATHAAGALKDENLLLPVPKYYKVGYQAHHDNFALTEMVPEGQTVENWTEMITTQIYSGSHMTFDQYRTDMVNRWQDACDDAQSYSLSSGTENGYDYEWWLQTCQFKDDTRKPEFTWFKMIRGNDAVYVVQKAFHFQPTKEESVELSKYMKKIQVCDTRLENRACPMR
ncbi:hypothetical protein [Trinickia dabaoshanensis]|uniref:hypothetical protein n=1 Tax=Trinickia dabaoshanensis TaxID=564714 RepID=UPI0011AFBF20|nr:hypothetical protein [Trinickia dabaoshanensis]